MVRLMFIRGTSGIKDLTSVGASNSQNLPIINFLSPIKMVRKWQRIEDFVTFNKW